MEELLSQVLIRDKPTESQEDWDGLSRAWNAPIPSGYIQFMSWYGAGEFGDYMSILSPVRDLATDADYGMAFETQNAQSDWEDEDREKFSSPPSTHPRLICWAVSSDANMYCWDLDDPGGPIYVYHRLGDVWNTYQLSISEFIAGLISESIPGYLDSGHAEVFDWEIPLRYIQA
ncbi:SMI1/KNR4 family protein [Nocardioides sp. NPDC059952]|uniref:SMI1/KNR4 family protein n=1 Tax=Nocardioides sp. NPDC059952 TaxID=3347014 RepID=UPI003666DED0